MTTPSKSGRCLAALKIATVLLAAVTTLGGPALGETWPVKPIRAIIPIAAGSAADIIPRAIFEPLARQLGQPIIVENRPGAGGTIGAAAVSRSESDGYTILVMSSSFTIVPSVYANLPYDAQRDFTAIAILGNLPNVLVVAPSKGFKSIQDLVAAARAKPGALTYASVGAGTAMHLNAERFRLSAEFQAQHIPFKGAPAALTEVMTGRVDFAFIPLLPALPLIQDGKLTALGVGSAQRSSILPDVPTTLEAGFVASDYNFWLGMFAPAKTPREVVDRLSGETRKALRSPEVREKLSKFGVEPISMSPDQFQAYVKDEIAANAMLAKSAGLAVQQ
jgi:tripartite-type tricarboxylate transporter receptor subunit TctC